MKKLIKYLLIAGMLGIIAVAGVSWYIVLKPNVKGPTVQEIKIPSGTSFNDLYSLLTSSGVLRNGRTFIITAKLKRFDRSVKPGFYTLEPSMSNNKIIDIIRSGRQTPVNITFNNIRTLNDLCGRIGAQLEADSASLMAFFSDVSNYRNDGFSRETIISVFIPDTYQLYWTTDAQGFYTRMLREYKSFWNENRVAQAEKLNLTPVDVSILASIIDDEIDTDVEKPRIAGVYLNRLRMGMPLQACPTIKFALNDFTIRRVLYDHLTVESPYNTYKYSGLPPGPIRCPSKAGIEAVLNAENHDYLYFEAKADFSGGHHFSRTLAEHNRYADEYQRELNKRKIYQ